MDRFSNRFADFTSRYSRFECRHKTSFQTEVGAQISLLQITDSETTKTIKLCPTENIVYNFMIKL
jgi:hypothetical protein